MPKVKYMIAKKQIAQNTVGDPASTLVCLANVPPTPYHQVSGLSSHCFRFSIVDWFTFNYFPMIKKTTFDWFTFGSFKMIQKNHKHICLRFNHKHICLRFLSNLGSYIYYI